MVCLILNLIGKQDTEFQLLLASMLPRIKYLLKKEIQNFINQHLDKPSADLLFMAKKYPKWDMGKIAQQVEGKQKAKTKFYLV